MTPRYLTVLLLVGSVIVCACGGTEAPPIPENTDAADTGNGTVIRLDSRLDAIVPINAYIEKIADGFGLEFRNFDNRIFEVALPGKGPESLGVFTHGDVVPDDPEK